MYDRVEALYVIRVYQSCKNAEQRIAVRDWFSRIKDNFDREIRGEIYKSLPQWDNNVLFLSKEYKYE